MKIKVHVWHEDNVWCGSAPAFPGCHTWGETYDLLLDNFREAVQGWLDVASERTPPDPGQEIIELTL